MKVDKTKWEKKALGNCCKIQLGTRIVKKQTIEGCFPVYGGGGATFTTNEYNRENAILISRFALSRQCTRFVYGKFFLNDSGLTVVPKDETIVFDFLKWQIFSLNDNIYALARGAAQKNLDMGRFPLLQVIVPSLSEQQAIATELDSIQTMIDGYKAQLTDLDALTQSIFLDMFGDPVSNPKGWKKSFFSALCNIVRGPFGGSLKKECFVSEGYAVYEQQNAIYDMYNFRYFIDEAKFLELRRFEVKPNDLIMSCAGTMGRVSIVPSTAPRGIINQALMKISILKDLNVTYLKFLMESSLFQESIENQAKGVAMKNIAAVGTLKNIKIPVPDINYQQQFAQQIEAIEMQKDLLREQLRDAETLMAERMQYYFS